MYHKHAAASTNEYTSKCPNLQNLLVAAKTPRYLYRDNRTLFMQGGGIG